MSKLQTMVVYAKGHHFAHFRHDLEQIGWQYDAHELVFTHEKTGVTFKPFEYHGSWPLWLTFKTSGTTPAPF